MKLFGKSQGWLPSGLARVERFEAPPLDHRRTPGVGLREPSLRRG